MNISVDKRIILVIVGRFSNECNICDDAVHKIFGYLFYKRTLLLSGVFNVVASVQSTYRRFEFIS